MVMWSSFSIYLTSYLSLKQLLYETCLCVWLLSYYEPAIEYLATSRALPRLIDVVKGSTKEKVSCISCYELLQMAIFFTRPSNMATFILTPYYLSSFSYQFHYWLLLFLFILQFPWLSLKNNFPIFTRSYIQTRVCIFIYIHLNASYIVYQLVGCQSCCLDSEEFALQGDIRSTYGGPGSTAYCSELESTGLEWCGERMIA